MKTYPGLKLECDDYDPRFRPWYVAATTGRKNVIILMDISGSMAENNKMKIAKEAAESVINTLGPADTFAFIPFAENSRSLGFTRIVYAT